MSVFTIISVEPNQKLETAIQITFPDDHYRYSPNQWFVCAGGTSREVAEKLKIQDKENGPGSAVVLSVSAYWGRASQDLWEWLKVKWEKDCA